MLEIQVYKLFLIFTDKVQSYGFRGEALYSLCSLASVTVITRTVDDEVARSYVFDSGGNVVESKVSHGLKGNANINIEFL